MHINGEDVGAELPKIDVINPANGEKVGSVPNGGKAEAKRAIEAAHTAFSSWSRLTAYERSNYLKKLNDLILENQEELAKTMNTRDGQTDFAIIGEAVYAATFVEWYAEEAKRIYGETIPSHLTNKRMQVWKKPVGVVGVMTPWNFPLP